jgi:glycerate 2-kinase
MKLLLAPDKLKGSLSASDACVAIARGVRRADSSIEVDPCPLADGGEGTADALLAALGGSIEQVRVTGPLGTPVEAGLALLADGRTAVIEMAAAAGLALVPEDRRDPARATSYGVGELMRAALDAGRTRLVVGLGGSATNDGGAGMAQALGVRFEGASEPITAAELERVRAVDRSRRDPRLERVEIVAACDVDSPLLGELGATRVYGPQKGARSEQLAGLERGLARLAELVPELAPEHPGAGAAGGLGFGLVAFAGARIAPGAELVLDAVDFDARLVGVELVLTAEGRLDAQSLRGKLPIAVARRARRLGVPSVALVGSFDRAALAARPRELCAWFSIVDGPTSNEQAIASAGELLAALAENVVRLATAIRR